MGESLRNVQRVRDVAVLMMPIRPLLPAVCTSAFEPVVRNAAYRGRQVARQIVSFFSHSELQICPVRWHDGR